jgi:hypothetical protein
MSHEAAVVGVARGERAVREAIAEVEHAIGRVMNEGIAVPLAPRRPDVRKLQHRLVTRYHVEAESSGREPRRDPDHLPRGGRALALVSGVFPSVVLCTLSTIFTSTETRSAPASTSALATYPFATNPLGKAAKGGGRGRGS